MTSIAIIGTEACGKTVFVTALAKRFMSPDEHGVFIEPRTRETAKYVDRVWRMLSDCDWPPSTNQGELNELQWRFHASDETSCDFRIIDCAGHDLRVLFSDEQIDNAESLPEPLQKVANYCRTADIVLFTVNINNFVEPDDREQQLANEWAIKYAMDFVNEGSHGHHYCLLLTQTDRYLHLVEEYENWDKIAEKFLPHVYAAHLASGKVPIFPVASVANTSERMIRNRWLLVPDINFGSEGLVPVVQWIAESTRSVLSRQANEKEASEARVRHERLQHEKSRRQEQARQEQLQRDEEGRQQREYQSQQSEQRRRRNSHAMPATIATFVLGMIVFYPAALAFGRYFYPLIEVKMLVTQEPQYKTIDVYEEQPTYVTEPIWVTVVDEGIFWDTTTQKKTGEEVVQRGTQKVKIGTEQVPTGEVVTLNNTFTNVIGIQSKAWFWVFLFPLLLSAIAAYAVFIRSWNHYVPNHYVPQVVD